MTTKPDENGRYPIESSNLAATRWDAHYNARVGVVEIAFRSGGVYRFYDVPYEVYRGLRRSKSPGRYFHRTIKGNFHFEKVAP